MSADWLLWDLTLLHALKYMPASVRYYYMGFENTDDIVLHKESFLSKSSLHYKICSIHVHIFKFINTLALVKTKR